MMFNVILIVCDSLRKDTGERYGKILSKYNFKYYSRVITPATWTLPSHVSLFTGLYPLQYKIHETKNSRALLNIKITSKQYDFLITNFLKTKQYILLCYSANPYISPVFGFKFFDKHYLYPPYMNILSIKERKEIKYLLEIKKLSRIDILIKYFRERKYILLFKIILQAILDRFIKIKKIFLSYFKSIVIDKGAKDILSRVVHDYKHNSELTKNPYFIFINFMEMHEPYLTKKSQDISEYVKFNKKIRGKINDKLIKKAYEKSAEYLMNKIDLFLKFLKKYDNFENTLIIITSDHGQLLGEHDKYGHGVYLDDELLMVPLWIKYPKNYKLIERESKGRWITLVNIKKFIIKSLENGVFDEGYLYSNCVFSESYGVHRDIPLNKIDEPEKYNYWNKYRIAIYYKDYKGIFNVTDWKFEEIITYDPKIEITEDVVKHMKKEVLKFLKTATIAKVPKVKL